MFITPYILLTLLIICQVEALWNLRSPKKDETAAKLSRIVDDKRHILKDAEMFSEEDVKNMNEIELTYNYFSQHDFDENNALDGLELFKALHHSHAHEDERYIDGHITEEAKSREFNDTIVFIDALLETYDTDTNGLLDFQEFMHTFNE